LAASEGTWLYASVVLSLLVGIRTEEARALRWDHVVTWVDDPAGWQSITYAGFGLSRTGEDRFASYVWRSEREGGDTKTEKSRSTLALPRRRAELDPLTRHSMSFSRGDSPGDPSSRARASARTRQPAPAPHLAAGGAGR
jgi:hypothetical protein